MSSDGSYYQPGMCDNISPAVEFYSCLMRYFLKLIFQLTGWYFLNFGAQYKLDVYYKKTPLFGWTSMGTELLLPDFTRGWVGVLTDLPICRDRLPVYRIRRGVDLVNVSPYYGY